MAARKRLAAVAPDDPGPQLPIETVEVILKGKLTGFHLTMRHMTTATLIAMERGKIGELEALELVTERTVTHNFPVKDLAQLDYWMTLAILAGWRQAQKADILPLVNESS